MSHNARMSSAPFVSAVSVAACDGMRDCEFTELEDRGACGVDLVVPARVLVRSYTAFPGVWFRPCVPGTPAFFYDPNATDPDSVSAPHWKRTLATTFVQEGDACVLSESPPTDGLTAVFDLSGLASGTVEFGRGNGTEGAVWFDRATEGTRGSWVTEGYAEIRVELDQRYVFPGCVEFPDNFTENSRLWLQSAHESTCGKIDSAEYAYRGLGYTTVSGHNATHDRWRFEVGGGAMFESFSVDVYVPLEISAMETQAPDPRSLLSGSVDVEYHAATYVLPVVLGTMLVMLVLECCVASCWGKKKNKS